MMPDETTRLPLTLPNIPPLDVELARGVLGSTLTLTTPSGPQQFKFSDITTEHLQAEAERIAAIEDRSAISSEIVECLIVNMAILEDARQLAERFLLVVEQLEKSKNQLDAISKTRIQGVERDVDNSGASSNLN